MEMANSSPGLAPVRHGQNSQALRSSITPGVAPVASLKLRREIKIVYSTKTVEYLDERRKAPELTAMKNISNILLAAAVIIPATVAVLNTEGKTRYIVIGLGISCFLAVVAGGMIKSNYLKKELDTQNIILVQLEASNERLEKRSLNLEAQNKKMETSLMEANSALTGHVTGGDSFPFMRFLYSDEKKWNFHILNESVFPIYDLHITIENVDAIEALADTKAEVGAITRSEYEKFSMEFTAKVIPPESDHIMGDRTFDIDELGSRIYVRFSARNGVFKQMMYIFEHEQPHMRRVISRLTKDGRLLKRTKGGDSLDWPFERRLLRIIED